MPPILTSIVILPPPITGQNLVTEAMCASFARRPGTILYAVRNSRNAPRYLWTIIKHISFFRYLALGALQSRRKGRLYFVPDAKMGLWLNLLQAPLMRIGFSEVWLHHHVFSYARSRDWKMFLFLKILGRSANHIVLAKPMAERLKRFYGVKRVTILGNAGFVKDIPPPIARRKVETVGFLGNITREKGVGLFMDILRHVQSIDRSLQCIIAGPVNDTKLRDEIEAFCAEMPERREWHGLVEGYDKTRFFKNLDVLLFPSLYENEALPVTIYEALATGTPVLATRRGCIPEQLAGQDWTFEDAEFQTRATSILMGWTINSEDFAQASLEAFNNFDQHKKTDILLMDLLLDRLCAPIPHQEDKL